MVLNGLVTIPTILAGWLILIAGLVVLWVIISIPVYIAGKAVTRGRAHFGQAMGATLGGGLAYSVVYYGVILLLGSMLGSPAAILALVLALLVWLAVYRASFETG